MEKKGSQQMAPFFIAEYAIKFQTVSQSVPEWLGLSRRWPLVILSLIRNPSLADLEKRYIERTLEQSGWRIEGKRGALAVLRISRSALYDKMRRYGVKRPF